MKSTLLLQQCPTRLIWRVFEMAHTCLYSCCFVRCCLWDLFNTTRNILMQLPSSFLSIHLVSIHVMHPDSSGIMVRVFACGPGDWGSIPGRVIPKTQKMLLDATLLNTQHYKVWIKGKVEQSRERSSVLP